MLSRESTADYFLRVLDTACFARGKTAWLEKTPRHLYFNELIGRVDPNVRFVHLVRDGVEVAASMSNASKHWKVRRTAEAALERWQVDLQFTRKAVAKPNHFVVTYDQLVASPEKVVLELASHIGISLKDSDFANRGHVLAGIVRADESWKLDTAGRPISRLGRTKSHLSEAELGQLDRIIDRTDYSYLAALAVKPLQASSHQC